MSNWQESARKKAKQWFCPNHGLAACDTCLLLRNGWTYVALWTSFGGGGSRLLYIIGFGLYFKQECVVCQTKITQLKEYVWLLRAGTAEKPTLVVDEIQYRPT